jgi:hypothetical protein
MMRSPTEMISWLASYPKSGNTWVRMLLSAYRNNGYIDINDSAVYHGDSVEYFYQVVAPLQLSALGGNAKFLLRPAALLHQIVSNPYRPLIMKTHNCNAVLDKLVTLFPPELTARAIYVVRDPRDLVSSVAAHMGKTEEEAVAFMNETGAAIGDNENRPIPSMLHTWSSHVQSWTTEEAFPVLLVRYEDLIADSITEFIKILEFLEYEVDQDRAIKSVEACELAKLRTQEDESSFREKSKNTPRFFNKGGSRWQNELDSGFVRQIEADHGEMMTTMGYELTTSPKLEVVV